jgi:F-type H+-transporting ATPase subunit gamma
MSRRRELEHHRHSLGEIREIMNSMKTLAYMETRKLARFLPAQQTVVKSIEAMAADFLSFHPGIPAEAAETMPVFLMIGTERGFCGDINRALMDRLAAVRHAEKAVQPRLLAVGHKLHPLLEDGDRVAAFVDGASTAEEVPAVLKRLVHELSLLQSGGLSLTLYGIYHDDNGIAMNRLLPPFQHQLHTPPSHPHPPLMNISAEELLIDLTDHYLLAALHQILYTSLMVENRRRVTHLEGAVKHMDEESSDLMRQCNRLRQEEIIEEIEVILLSSAKLDDGPGASNVSKLAPSPQRVSPGN